MKPEITNWDLTDFQIHPRSVFLSMKCGMNLNPNRNNGIGQHANTHVFEWQSLRNTWWYMLKYQMNDSNYSAENVLPSFPDVSTLLMDFPQIFRIPKKWCVSRFIIHLWLYLALACKASKEVNGVHSKRMDTKRWEPERIWMQLTSWPVKHSGWQFEILLGGVKSKHRTCFGQINME